MKNKPVKFDESYLKWIEEVSKRFRQSQIKAAVKVNDEMLRFYWSVGKDVSLKSMEAKYGSGFYNKLSADLRNLIPEAKSFSVTNLRYMRYFYDTYPDAVNSQQLVENLQLNQNPQQVAEDFEKDCVFGIPWGHHIAILGRCRSNPDKALFYVRMTMENNWSRAVLLNNMDTELYERQGKAITNFAVTLPAPQSDLAQAITRDPYNFDFLTMREKYDEKELKDALTNKVESFLMELGTGFAFMGREVRLEIGNTEKFLDMLFYNAKQHCYVVVEVKAVEFDSSFAGQLGTYVVAVNHQLKTANDNPTIGLLICKGMDKVEAQYALESTSQPLGVSSYQLSKIIPDGFKGSLPTIEEIEAELSE